MTNYKNCKYIQPYIDLILENKIKHCIEQEQLVKNIVLPVIARDDVYIDEDKIEKGLSLQKYFPYQLIEWERFLFALIVGVFYTNGRIYFTDIRVMIGRGNGKNGFISFLAFYFLSQFHGIDNYDIDILANTEKQAKTSFNDLYELIRNPINTSDDEKENLKLTRAILKNYSATKTEIQGKKTKSILRYNSSSKRGKDSKRSGCVIYDEKHEYLDNSNISTLRSGLGKVRDGREITITTDGVTRGGVIDLEKEQNKEILREYNPKNRTLVFCCRIEKEEEWSNPEFWIKANPSINDFPDLLDVIEKEVANMKYTPDYYYEFLAKRMNYIAAQGDSEVASWDDICATNKPVIDLKGLPCVIGVDFAKTNDFVATCAMFKKSGLYYAIIHGWVCKKSKDLRGIKAPIDEWVRKGLLTIVDDVEIPADLIADWIADIGSKHNIKIIGVDNFRYSYLNGALKKIGFDAFEKKNVKLIRPSDIMKTSIMINSVFVNQKLIVGDNPYFRWNVNNTKLCTDSRGNQFYGKIEPHYRKTDAFMAFVNAMCLYDELPDYQDSPTVIPTFTF